MSHNGGMNAPEYEGLGFGSRWKAFLRDHPAAEALHKAKLARRMEAIKFGKPVTQLPEPEEDE